MSTERSGQSSAETARGLRWRFADCVLDERSLELVVNGQLVKLEPKPLDLLMTLLRHAGEVVTKDELQDLVWPGRVLSESVLSKAMAKLRLGLADEEQRIIKTVHGFGYRLVAPVMVEKAAATQTTARLELAAGDTPPLRAHWRLRKPIGRGGFGDVWLAEHEKTGERHVFKFGLDAPGLDALKREITLWRVLRQTHGERRDFVKVLDWNLEEAPYFVESEYAEGGSLAQWAERSGGLTYVPLAQRIEWMAQAADALAAAHVAAVLHKDLKPSNLLLGLDEGGTPYIKLGDFGSGRLLDLTRIEQLEITRMGFAQTQAPGDSASGTPFYFAPELLAGESPTVQTDVYALGVMLYQVVVGDLSRPLAPGWERDIEDVLLREDIASAAASHRDGRTGDVAELAWNLRHLDERRAQREHEDALRRETERLRRALERSRLRRSWTRALVTVLIAGIGATGFGLWRASHERRQAEAAREEARAAVRFLSDDVLAATDPFGGGRPRLTLHGLLEEAAPKLAQQLQGFPVARAEIGLAMGRAYEGLGDWDGARQRLETALEEAVGAVGGDAELSLAIADRLAYISLLQSRFDEADQLFEKVYRARSKRLGELHPDTLATRDGMAWLEYEQGHYAEAARRYEALVLDYGSKDPPGLNSVLWSLADCELELNHLARAEALMRRVLADSAALQGASHPRVLWQMTTLGDVLMSQGRYDEAAQFFDQAHAGLVASVGESHPYTLIALHYQGTLKLERGDPESALPLLRRAYAGRVGIHGEDHVWSRFSANRVGEALTQLGRVSEALPLLQTTYTAAVAAQGPAHPNVLLIGRSLANALIADGRYDDADSLLQQALVHAQQSLPSDNLRIAYLYQSLGDLRTQQRRADDAQRELAAAYAIHVSALGEGHPQTQHLQARLQLH